MSRFSNRLACRVVAAPRASAHAWYSVSQAGRGGITIGRRSKTQAHTTADGAVVPILRGAVRNAERAPSRSRDASPQPKSVPCTAASRRSGGDVQLSARRSTRAAKGARSIPEAAQLLCSVGAQSRRSAWHWITRRTVPESTRVVHVASDPSVRAVQEAVQRWTKDASRAR